MGKRIFLLGISFLLPSMAFGYYGSSGKNENDLSIAGGIASPGPITSVFQNPAGLSNFQNFGLTAQAGSSQNNFKDPSLTGGFFWGNGSAGLMAGVRDFTGTPGVTQAVYGLGLMAPSLRASFGLAGATTISPSGQGSSFNAGTIIHPSDTMSVGITAMDLSNGPGELGVGVGFDLGSSARFVVDSSMDKSFKSLALEPGLRVNGAKAALQLSYGLTADGSAMRSFELQKGFSGGVSYLITDNATIDVQFKQIERVYAALAYRF